MMSVLTLLAAVDDGGGVGAVAALAVVFALFLLFFIYMWRAFLYICRPNEVLVVSGKRTVLPGGETLNFAVIQAGRHWRVPFVQTVNRMDVRLIPIELVVTKVLSNGGHPLHAHPLAQPKITSHPPYNPKHPPRLPQHPPP